MPTVVYSPSWENNVSAVTKAFKQKGEIENGHPEKPASRVRESKDLPLVAHDPGKQPDGPANQPPVEKWKNTCPRKATKLTDEERSIIEAWINSGAIIDKMVLELSDTTSIYSLRSISLNLHPKDLWDFEKSPR